MLTVGQYYIERYFARGGTPRAAADAAAADAQAAWSPAATAEAGEIDADRRRTSMSEPMVKAEGVHKRFGRSRC